MRYALVEMTHIPSACASGFKGRGGKEQVVLVLVP
jgi:hypothetical protein